MTVADGSSDGLVYVTSGMYDHEYENGRRYHSYKHGRYPVPNDDVEQNREDMKHALMLELTGGKLIYSPIGDNPQKILDIGTGTGIWAIEMGDKYPRAEVIGIDLSPIQPAWVPPNVKFFVDDAEDEWMNGSDFDLIHFRTMSGILKDIQKAVDCSYQNLKPGGWIEFQELHPHPQCDDGTMAEDDPLLRLAELSFGAFLKFGIDCHKPLQLQGILERAGFANIQKITKKVPIGPWAEDKSLRVAGQYMKLSVLDLIPSFTGRLFQAFGLSQADGEVAVASARKSLEDPSIHRYYDFHFYFGQKPEAS